MTFRSICAFACHILHHIIHWKGQGLEIRIPESLVHTPDQLNLGQALGKQNGTGDINQLIKHEKGMSLCMCIRFVHV